MSWRAPERRAINKPAVQEMSGAGVSGDGGRGRTVRMQGTAVLVGQHAARGMCQQDAADGLLVGGVGGAAEQDGAIRHEMRAKPAPDTIERFGRSQRRGPSWRWIAAAGAFGLLGTLLQPGQEISRYRIRMAPVDGDTINGDTGPQAREVGGIEGERGVGRDDAEARLHDAGGLHVREPGVDRFRAREQSQRECDPLGVRGLIG